MNIYPKRLSAVFALITSSVSATNFKNQRNHSKPDLDLLYTYLVLWILNNKFKILNFCFSPSEWK